MRVVNIAEMKEIKKRALEEFALEESLIIENIAIKGANKIQEKFLAGKNLGEIIILVGKGNNGSDGLAIGRHLREFGHRVRALMLFDESECSKELKRQAKMAYGMGVKITEVRSEEQVVSYFQEAQVKCFVIDAIFGTGVRLPLSTFIHNLIKIVNQYASLCIAVDMPSGVEGDTGMNGGVAIKADYTLAVGVPKIGYYSPNGAEYMGEIIIISAGFPQNLISQGSKNLIGIEFMSKILGKRNKFAHKNSFGHILLVGGSPGQVGALVLAANGALKVGAGLVTAITWEESFNELSMKLNAEIISSFIPKSSKELRPLMDQLEYFDTVVIGPGLGRGPDSKHLVQEILMNFAGPVVLDADAIHCLDSEEGQKLLKGRKEPVVMTPHLGEFAAFTHQSVAEVVAAPLENLRALIDKVNAHVILKGPGTYVGLPKGDVYINYMPNAGMATGGSGDVLAGIIGGFLAQAATKNQSFNPNYMNNEWDASIIFGVFIHSLAGVHAAKTMGVRAMSAWSIINHVHHAFSDIHQFNLRT